MTAQSPSSLPTRSTRRALTVAICSVLYPILLWVVGETIFPSAAHGSLIDENGDPVTDPAKAKGSRLIGQPFTSNEYFRPRPSNAGSGNGYDASASGASNWGASNPLLRSRVARAKQLMADQSLSLTQVAFNSGFASSSQFATTFRRIEGMTPTAYRRGL